MSVTVTELSQFERCLTFSFGRTPLDRAETRASRRLSRDIDINGFRRGKAPRRLVERVVGRQRIRSHAIEDLLRESLPRVLREEELFPAVSPSVDDIREINGGLEVDVRVSLWPALDRPPDYKGRSFELDHEMYAIDEERIESEIDSYRKQFAELETVERASVKGDYLAIDLHVSQDGNSEEPISISDFLYEVGEEHLLEGLDEELTGRSAGDSGVFTGELRFSTGGLEAGTPVDVRVLVKEVKESRLPELDDDWVSDFTEFETVEEFREEVISELQDSRLSALRLDFSNKVMDDLLVELEVEIPSAVIDAETTQIHELYRRRLERFGMSLGDSEWLHEEGEGYLAELRQQADMRIRTRILLDVVAQEAGLEVEETEMAAAYEDLASRREETGQQLAEQWSGSVQESMLVGNILRAKALDILMEGAVAADRYGNVIDLRFDPPDGEDIVEAVIE